METYSDENTILRIFRYKGVVYMIGMDQRVYNYNTERPIQVGNWDKKRRELCFLPGALEALKSGDESRLLGLHIKS